VEKRRRNIPNFENTLLLDSPTNLHEIHTSLETVQSVVYRARTTWYDNLRTRPFGRPNQSPRNYPPIFMTAFIRGDIGGGNQILQDPKACDGAVSISTNIVTLHKLSRFEIWKSSYGPEAGISVLDQMLAPSLKQLSIYEDAGIFCRNTSLCGKITLQPRDTIAHLQIRPTPFT